MAIEMDPDKINDHQRDADAQIEARVLESGNGYAADNADSKSLNKSRTKRRNEIKEMGFRTDAYQTAIHVVKDLTPTEGKDFIRDLQTFVRILGAKQADLFPDEQLKAAKREERISEKKSKAGRTQAELDAETNANPRSDPAVGGAGARPPVQEDGTPWPDDADVAAREAAEGDAVLDALAPKTKKLSQSAKAKAKLAAAGLN